MTDLLAQARRGLLSRLVASDVLLGFDFDGTLAPIVPEPDRARMRSRTRQLLRETARRYPCAVISGRARADVAARLADTGVQCIIGNHGLEWDRPLPEGRRIAQAVARWRSMLAQALGGLDVEIEDKIYSLTIHTRRLPRGRTSREAVWAAAGRLPGARLVAGKHVVNVLPSDGGDKGEAVALARKRLRCQTALYVGDDATDEAVFERGAREGWLTVRVGPSHRSSAAHFVRAQREMDRMLEILIGMRGL